ncbi:hypothetical protein NDU88_007235 [Pleurodeles waltl]|uniref:Uncharacterized protein n=1 Tax=Pleurodeles waltl TaxID=8319 RepID=A0AAV7RU70_PLEWA|nr:hypothetical protein NDU88_007235 [Pleurodeles waltl]
MEPPQPLCLLRSGCCPRGEAGRTHDGGLLIAAPGSREKNMAIPAEPWGSWQNQYIGPRCCRGPPGPWAGGDAPLAGELRSAPRGGEVSFGPAAPPG